MSHPRPDWQATGAFQVGVACQASGRYDEAITAYRQVLARPGFGEHVPTLHNLAVSQIRAHDAAGAIKTLDRIDRIVPANPGRPEVRERRWNAAYNRALALQYLAETADALEISRGLLRDLLAQPAAHPLEAPTLMLHAGLLLSVDDPLDAGTARRIPEGVRDCAVAIATRSPDAAAPSRSDMRAAIASGAERPEQIDAYVTAHCADDSRARYNLLCFHARLAERLPHARGGMLEIAKQDAKVAFRDRRLAAWASEDPALKLRHLQAHRAWRSVLAPPAPATPRASEPADDDTNGSDASA